MSDFKFRFPVNPKNSQLSGLYDLIGNHLARLLNMAVPVSEGKDRLIEAFRMLNDEDTLHRLDEWVSEGDKSIYDIYEPRIEYIKSVLESLLNVVDLESNGKKVDIDGFSLKNLPLWLTPGSGASDILAHAASGCRMDCLFCYNKGTHPPFDSKKTNGRVSEIKARIKAYAPNGKMSLFHGASSPCEALDHPKIKDILTGLRKKTDELIRIPSHGANLTPDMVDFLAKMPPVLVDVSLNSSTPGRRNFLMNDKHPQTAINSLDLLNKARIPFTIVIVPWPEPNEKEMLKDLSRTVLFAASKDPMLIQISLPGYTAKFSSKVLFDRDQVWKNIRAEILKLRQKTDCPIVLRPGAFEEHDNPRVMNEPVPAGVIKNSPAARAGLEAQDKITRINGLKVKSRIQAASLLKLVCENGISETVIEVIRDGHPVKLDVRPGDHQYPYSSLMDSSLGVVFPFSGVPDEWFEKLKNTVAMRDSRHTLVMTSQLLKPYMEKNLPGSIGSTKIYSQVPENKFFGGNIIMGDLLVVQDFIDGIEDFMSAAGVQPDLVVLPSSPFHMSGWGRDLRGDVYLEIERATNIPVALIDCEPIFD